MNFQRKTVIDGITLALASGGLLVASGVQAEKSTMLEEVSVTADKRLEKLQNVPVSVTAFSADGIVDAGIENTQDFIDLTPNVTLDDSYTVGNTFVTIRGVSQINNADSPIAIVVDGIPQNNQKQLKQELFDIERIEVLRGPQGAGYGRNAIGGAINIITKGPTNETEGYVKTGVYNGSGKTVSGAVGGPLVENVLLYRLAGNYRESDGLIDNEFLNQKVDDHEANNLRAQLRWLATDDFSMDIVYATSNMEGGSIYDTSFSDNAARNANTFINPSFDTPGRSERNTSDFHLKADLEFDAGTLSYMFGYNDLEEDYFGDADWTYLQSPLWDQPHIQAKNVARTWTQAQDLDVELTSHELRWTSAYGERFRWIAGGFHQETNRTLDFFVTQGPQTFLDSVNDNENKAWAVFGQAEYDLTDQLEVSGSIRYDRDKRHQVSSGKKETFDAWQPKATLTYAFTDNNLGLFKKICG